MNIYICVSLCVSLSLSFSASWRARLCLRMCVHVWGDGGSCEVTLVPNDMYGSSRNLRACMPKVYVSRVNPPASASYATMGPSSPSTSLTKQL